jgi:exopolysaccharide production protein ExoY
MPRRKTPVDVRPSNVPRQLARHENSELAAPGSRRIVVVGTAEDIPRALQHPAAGDGRFEVVAALAIDVESTDKSTAPSTLATLIERHRAQTILVAGSVGPKTMRRIADVALRCRCDLLAVMPTEILAGHDPVIVWSGESPLVQLAGAPKSRLTIQLKRALDIALSSVGLVISAPLLAILAIAIRIESSGAVVFRHERVGRFGRKFQCLKFRTMRSDAEAVLLADPLMYDEYRRNHFKIPDDRDPRVTSVGRFVRRTSLDELPQLWNVLVGEMSLVGPRPMVEEELLHYGEARELLLSVRPGITGAWAVSGRHAVGYPERCEIELGYVRQWTLWSDASALARTVGAVLRPGG